MLEVVEGEDRENNKKTRFEIKFMHFDTAYCGVVLSANESTAKK